MPTLDLKKKLVDTLCEDMKNSEALYLANFNRVNVEKMTALRRMFQEKGIKMRVMKNSLLKRAFESLKIQGLEKYLVGPSTLILPAKDDPIEPAKLLKKFYKENEQLFPIKAIQMEAEVHDGSEWATLASMPGRVELQSQILGMAIGAGAQLLAIIKGPGSIIAGQVNALSDKLENQNS